MNAKENLDIYLNSYDEGDNITITADLLDTLEATSKDLEILKIEQKLDSIVDIVLTVVMGMQFIVKS